MHRARADVSWSGNRLLGGALKALSSTLSDALRQTACLSRIQQDAPSSGDIAVSLRRCKTPHESAAGAVQAYEKTVTRSRRLIGVACVPLSGGWHDLSYRSCLIRYLCMDTKQVRYRCRRSPPKPALRGHTKPT